MKYLGIIVIIALALLALAVGYGMLQQKAETTAVVVEKHSDRLEKMQEIDMKQTIMLERNTMLIDEIEKR